MGADATALGLVGPAPPWAGGIPTFTSALAEALRPRAAVDWISWRPPRVLPPTTHLDPGAPVPGTATALLGPYDSASWRRVGERLRGCDAVVLTVTHPTMAIPYGALVGAYRRGARAGGRVVLLCHNVEDHEARRALRPLTRRLLRLGDAVVVHAASEAGVARRYGVEANVVEAFHPCYEAFAERPPTPAPGRERLLFFGYVRAYKGLEDLLEALALLPSATLDVVGRFERGTDRHRSQIRRLGLEGRVRLDDRFVPESEVPHIFDRADLVVAPYRQASQSGVVHLAYSLGRPVVATAVGGLRESIVEGRTGLLAPPRDPVALAAVIARALALGTGAFDDGLRAVQTERSWSRYAGLVLAAASTTTRSFTGRKPA